MDPRVPLNRGKLMADLVEDRAIEFDEVHLVHGEHQRRDSQQLRDTRVAPRLLPHAMARVDQQDRQVCRGGARRHIARVLFVAGRVGQDELPVCRCKIPVGDVDRDALFPLCAEAVGEQGEVDRPGALVARRGRHRTDLIVVHAPRVVQQASDERALPIVHASGGAEA